MLPPMKVILFGATGMIGEGALIECLDDDTIESVLVIARRSTGRSHPKLNELLVKDFLDWSTVAHQLAGYDACLYCLGISAVGMSDEDYRRITYDFTVAAATAMLEQNPSMRMCFISGAGTDLESRQMWARVKAEAEQALLAMAWRSAHMFRPAGIFPRKGVVSSVRLYRVMYGMLGWAYPLLHTLMPNQLTTTDQLGRALIEVAKNGHSAQLLESKDINAICD